jgi:hypothetical protein
MENKAKIILTRPRQWFNQTRTFRIWIDGNEMGSIRNGSSETVMVDPGNHSLQCRLAWYGSPEIRLSLEPGESSWFRVRNGMKYYWPSFIILLLGILLNLFAVNRFDVRPIWAPLLELVLILPALLYMLYYMTIGRKRYLVLEDDKENAFNG